MLVSMKRVTSAGNDGCDIREVLLTRHQQRGCRISFKTEYRYIRVPNMAIILHWKYVCV
jgi:hypothetical protein